MTFLFINSKPLWKYISETILIFQQIFWINRSSRSQMFFKIGLLKNYAIIAGKYLCWSLFLISLQTWRLAALLKKTPTQVFPCEYSHKHLPWLLLNKVKTDVKSTWFILLPDWLYYVIKSIEILIQRYRNKTTKMQKQNPC